MKNILAKIGETLFSLYKGKNLIWQIVMVVLTILILESGLDWWYFSHLRNSAVFPFFSLAGMLGFFIPFISVIVFVTLGILFRTKKVVWAGYTIAVAGFFGWAISSFYKVFTGRIPPPQSFIQGMKNMSHGFQFGFNRGGIFWGWPSSHTAVAFAMSVALAVYYKDKKWIGVVAILYACYIAFGASINFHWLSDVVAGLILGSIVGIGFGNLFYKLNK